jgi:hypothetical protein
MQPLAAARFYEALQPQFTEELVQLFGRRDDPRPFDVRRRIEIENELIRFLNAILARIPYMNLESTDLSDRH